MTKDSRFLYDGWNLVAEFEMNPLHPSTFILHTSYAWGLDLSGTEQGAGGVGGLLLTMDHSPSAISDLLSSALAPCYDGNGNVMALVELSSQTLTARYEYSPFGETIIAEGPQAEQNPFRFSTKYTDEETGLLYYGYRYYSPELGRWPSRDPIGERGGINLYGMAGNDAVNEWDYIGLTAQRKCRSTIVAGHGWHEGDGGAVGRRMKSIQNQIDKGTRDGNKGDYGGKCDRVSGVGCFSGNINNQYPSSVRDPMDQFNDPNIPDFTNDRPNVAEPGFLWPDEAMNALYSKIEAAKVQAEADCTAEGNCCKSITIDIQCEEGHSQTFAKVADGRGKKICGSQYTYDCKNKKWDKQPPTAEEGN